MGFLFFIKWQSMFGILKKIKSVISHLFKLLTSLLRLARVQEACGLLKSLPFFHMDCQQQLKHSWLHFTKLTHWTELRAFTLWKEGENEWANTCINKENTEEAHHPAPCTGWQSRYWAGQGLSGFCGEQYQHHTALPSSPRACQPPEKFTVFQVLSLVALTQANDLCPVQFSSCENTHHVSGADNCIDPLAVGSARALCWGQGELGTGLVRICKFDSLAGLIPISLGRATHKIGSAKCANKWITFQIMLPVEILMSGLCELNAAVCYILFPIEQVNVFW